jgi:GT2 family glycosyltransferase
MRQIPDARVKVFLTDDGCTDDTVARAREACHDIEIIPGNGSLYWAAGMAAAESRAMCWEPNFFLWLNDDVVLLEDSLISLLKTSMSPPLGIAIGATMDPDDGLLTYGGVMIHGSHPQRSSTLSSSPTAQSADTFHGNIVLIPKVVHDRVGRIDGGFDHGYADFDYGLRANRVGVSILQAPGFAGECRRNPQRTRFAGSLRGRWRAAQDPVTGLPWRSQIRYLRRHAGVEWPLYAMWSVVHRFIRG